MKIKDIIEILKFHGLETEVRLDYSFKMDLPFSRDSTYLSEARIDITIPNCVRPYHFATDETPKF